MTHPIAKELLELSHQLGREDQPFAILGEGNTSAGLDEKTFLVKASGCQLGTLTQDQLTECHYEPLLGLLLEEEATREEVDEVLLSARKDEHAAKPSLEAMFHAWLLSLEGVSFVGHCHPVRINQILCSPRAVDFASARMFPDEVICCGTSSVLVPYADPGLALAKQIREETLAYMDRHEGFLPRLILLKNHGAIAIGTSAAGVLATLRMAEKAAAIFIGAASLGGPDFLPRSEVRQLSGRPDEIYRQKQLKLS